MNQFILTRYPLRTFISVNFMIISLLTTKQINVNLLFLYSGTKFINYTLVKLNLPLRFGNAVNQFW